MPIEFYRAQSVKKWQPALFSLMYVHLTADGTAKWPTSEYNCSGPPLSLQVCMITRCEDAMLNMVVFCQQMQRRSVLGTAVGYPIWLVRWLNGPIAATPFQSMDPLVHFTKESHTFCAVHSGAVSGRSHRRACTIGRSASLLRKTAV